MCSVYADGSICLDILQNRWSPTYDVSAILTSIQVSGVDQVCIEFLNHSHFSLDCLNDDNEENY